MENEILLQAISNMIDEKLAPVESNLELMIDRKLAPIKNDLEQMNSEMSALRSGQIDMRKAIRKIDGKVSDTYDLALEAWGKSIENRTWPEDSKLPIA